MRLLGFGEGLIQKFDRILLDYPKDNSIYLKWNYLTQSFDSSLFNSKKLNTSLTKEELKLILREIRACLHLRRFKNFEYNESN